MKVDAIQIYTQPLYSEQFSLPSTQYSHSFSCSESLERFEDLQLGPMKHH